MSNLDPNTQNPKEPNCLTTSECNLGHKETHEHSQSTETTALAISDHVQNQLTIIGNFESQMLKVLMTPNPETAPEEEIRDLTNIASTIADAELNLVLELVKGTTSAGDQQLLIGKLSDLKPGPYAEYILQALSKLGKVEEPILNCLKSLEAKWQEAYGSKIAYGNNLAQLRSCIEPPRPGFVRRLIQALRPSWL